MDWCTCFTLKIQHGCDWERSRPQGPKNVYNFLMTVRPLSWACGHGTEMLLMLEKSIFDLIIQRYFPIWQSKEMSHDFVRCQSVAETCCGANPSFVSMLGQWLRCCPSIIVGVKLTRIAWFSAISPSILNRFPANFAKAIFYSNPNSPENFVKLYSVFQKLAHLTCSKLKLRRPSITPLN